MSVGYIPPVARTPRALPVTWSHAAGSASGWRRAFTTDMNNRNHSSRRALILDMDDTLYPRERFVLSGFAAVASHVEAVHGIPAQEVFATLSRARASGGHGVELQALCAEFGLAADLVPAFVDVIRRHTPVLWLYSDVAGVLRQLRANGWRLAVLTNGLPSVQFRKVAALGLASLVDDIIYAEEHAPGGKPAAAAFRAALRALDVTADQCVCVGDDLLRDVHGARALDIRTIRVARPGVTVPGLVSSGDADLVITQLAELPQAATLLREMVSANVA